jgi:hypothetical protein
VYSKLSEESQKRWDKDELETAVICCLLNKLVVLQLLFFKTATNRNKKRLPF